MEVVFVGLFSFIKTYPKVMMSLKGGWGSSHIFCTIIIYDNCQGCCCVVLLSSNTVSPVKRELHYHIPLKTHVI